MANLEQYIEEDIHPIDLVEHLAEHHDWDFDRIHDDQEQKLMVYRYGLVLAGGQIAGPDQIDTMINAAVMSAERYYPALQLVVWGERPAEEALQVAIAEAYGRA